MLRSNQSSISSTKLLLWLVWVVYSLINVTSIDIVMIMKAAGIHVDLVVACDPDNQRLSTHLGINYISFYKKSKHNLI